MTTYVVFSFYYGNFLGMAAVFTSLEEAQEHMRRQLDEELELLREEGYEGGHTLDEDYASVDNNDVWWQIKEIEL